MSEFWDQVAAFPARDREAWRRDVDKALKGRAFEDALIRPTIEGLPLEPLYTRRDLPAGAETERPGAAPFTRGFPAPSGDRPRRAWLRTVEVEHPDAARANAMLLADLTGGAERVVIKTASAGTMVAGSDDEVRARASSGRGGVWIADASDVASLLNDVVWSLAPVSLVAPQGAPGFTRTLFDACAALRHDKGEGLGVQIDLIGRAWNATDAGSWLSDDVPLIAADATRAQRADLHAADARPMLVSTTDLRMAGADMVQEIAAALGTFVAAVRACEGALDPGAVLRATEFRLGTGSDFFGEIAKLRAFRRCLALVLDTLGILDRAGDGLLTASSAEEALARRDLHVNLLRTTAQATAGVLGGADCVIALPFDLRHGGGAALGRRMARNLHGLLAEESDAGAVIDPAGGSFYIEHRTEQMAAAAWQQFVDWERMDGFVSACIGGGAVAGAIGERHMARVKRLRSRREPRLGVSVFPDLHERAPQPPPFDVTAFVGRWRARISADRDTAVRDMPAHHFGEEFERLRDRADRLVAGDAAPVVCGVLIGPPSTYAARLEWTRDLLATAGIRLDAQHIGDAGVGVPEGFAPRRFAATVVIAADALHGSAVLVAARGLRAAGASEVIVAGKPGEHEAAMRDAGVTRFIFAGADAVTFLDGLLSRAEEAHAAS